MTLKEIYDLIPWDVLRGWAESVRFDEKIVNPNFPKYKGWSDKAVYADFLMDHLDEGFNFPNVSYVKAPALTEKNLSDKDLKEVYKLFFDSYRMEEYSPGSPGGVEWGKRLQETAEYFKNRYGAQSN